jgi:hypothetical protein
MENYLRETGMQKPSGQMGAALIFPQRELFSDPLVKILG